MKSIIIPVHDALLYTRICVDSIRRHTDDWELIIVDNGSGEETSKWLGEQPDIRVVRNEENIGFPKAINQGIAVADGDILCLLNNDTVVTGGWLARLAGYVEQGDADIIGPMTNFCLGPQCLHDCAYTTVSDLDAYADSRQTHETGHVTQVEWIIGFCMVFKRSLVEEIGMLDERYGIGNSEDIDYCLTAKAAGYKVAFANDVFIHHFGGITHNLLNLDYSDLLARNAKRLLEKHGDKGRFLEAQNDEFLNEEVSAQDLKPDLMRNLVSLL